MTNRHWLAAILRGECPPSEVGPAQDLSSILESAESEGVLALIHERLQSTARGAAVPTEVRDLFATAAREKAMQSLMREAECRRILSGLEQIGLQALLLKGSALAHWVYLSPQLRECGDIDLLFRSRAEVDRAVSLLADLRYDARTRNLPGDLICFERTCVRGDRNTPGLEIDLHWRLSSAPMFAFRFDFQELWSASIELPSLGPMARGLAPVHAYLHACMHRVENMAWGSSDRLKWLFDLELLGRGFSADDWQSLADTAVDRRIAAVCVSAMTASAGIFGERAPAYLREVLREAARHEVMDIERMNRWSYIQRMNFLAFPNWAQRARWLRQRVLPTWAYLQERYGQDRGPLQIIATRLRNGLRSLAG